MSSSSNAFPGRSVISSFGVVEGMLGEILEIVPYCSDHQDVWSPRIATILLEACSQVDSLWKYEARLSPCVDPNKHLSIKDYYGYFGRELGPRWLIFWGDKTEGILPFKPWREAKRFEPADYDKFSLGWWKAYNDLKHDRLHNLREAKLGLAVHAVGGLLLAILRCELCREFVGASGWLLSTHCNPKVFLGEDSNSSSDVVVVETKLFSYPVGLWKRISDPVPPKEEAYFDLYRPIPSHRFHSWLESGLE